MAVPYIFGTATAAIPLSQLDTNFATPITIGNTAVQLSDTVTTLNNMTLANVTITSGTVTITNVAVTTANVSGTANVSTLVVVGNETVGGNTTVAGNITVSGGTANGVAYLNTSKVLTTGSALVFDGTNLGVGTSSPAAKLQVNSGDIRIVQTNNSANNGLYFRNSADSGTFAKVAYDAATGELQVGTTSTYSLLLQTNSTTRATLDSSGNLGIGVTPSAWGSPFTSVFQMKYGAITGSGVSDTRIFVNSYYDGTNYKYIANGFATRYDQSSGGHYWYNAPSGTAGNAITFTQAMTLDASGNLLVGTTSNASSRKLLVESSTPSGGYPFELKNTASSNPYGLVISYSAAAPNSTASSFLYLADNAALRFEVRSNGGIANYSANNVNLSDERTKTDIQNADSYLAKICAIPVRTFKYKDQTDDLLNLGCIAQEVEAVAPELVDVSGFGETPEDGVPLKAIYQTDLQYALMKCTQEQQSIIQQLTDRITALEAK